MIGAPPQPSRSRSRSPLAACLAMLAACLAWSCDGTDRRPDILLLTLDTVRADHLGIYGGDPDVSPRLDRLARQGVVFGPCDSASPLTLPSHATLLTGVYPPVHGLRSNGRGRLRGGVRTLAQQLQEAGYDTAAFVSSAVLDRRHGLGRGFATYDDGVGPAGERPADLTIDAALAWWSRPRTAPAFLWVHLFDAHAPYRPPEPWAERFAGRPYAGEIAFMDHEAGRLLDGMQGGRRGLVIAVAGDHGEGLGEHGEAEHGLLLFQSTLAVPCFLTAPERGPGPTGGAPARTLDLVPTLLGQVGVPAPPQAAGRDLLQPAAGAAAPEAGSAGTVATVDGYAETLLPWEDYGWHPLFAGRRGSAKIQQGAYTTYHDLAADPAEENPVLLPGQQAALTPGQQTAAAELAAMIARVRGTRATPDQEAPAGDVPRLPPEHLRSLGYLGGSAAPPSDSPPPGLRDPREQTDFHRRVGRALAAYRDGRAQAAAAILERILAEQPANPFVLDLAGSVAMARGQPAEAARLHTAALARTPDRGAVEVHLAEALLAMGRPREAEAACRRALEHLPGTPPARAALVLCRSLAAQERQEEAAACAADYLRQRTEAGGQETAGAPEPLLRLLLEMAGTTETP